MGGASEQQEAGNSTETGRGAGMSSIHGDFPINDGESRSVTVEGRPFLLLRQGGSLRLFENRCPHTGETLDPMGGSVLEAGGELITCQRHGAQFLSSSGECVAGPCIGEHLVPVDFTAVNGEIYLD
jgi:nitrite reductase/ring-hydroxylating ferredoxin subunit